MGVNRHPKLARVPCAARISRISAFQVPRISARNPKPLSPADTSDRLTAPEKPPRSLPDLLERRPLRLPLAKAESGHGAGHSVARNWRTGALREFSGGGCGDV